MVSDYTGNIHLVWAYGENREIYYNLLDSLMNPIKNKIKISLKPNILSGPPRLTINENYVLAVWDATLYSITRWGIFGRLLNINGDTLSSEVRIDSLDGISIERES